MKELSPWRTGLHGENRASGCSGPGRRAAPGRAEGTALGGGWRCGRRSRALAMRQEGARGGPEVDAGGRGRGRRWRLSGRNWRRSTWPLEGRRSEEWRDREAGWALRLAAGEAQEAWAKRPDGCSWKLAIKLLAENKKREEKKEEGG